MKKNKKSVSVDIVTSEDIQAMKTVRECIILKMNLEEKINKNALLFRVISNSLAFLISILSIYYMSLKALHLKFAIMSFAECIIFSIYTGIFMSIMCAICIYTCKPVYITLIDMKKIKTRQSLLVICELRLQELQLSIRNDISSLNVSFNTKRLLLDLAYR